MAKRIINRKCVYLILAIVFSMMNVIACTNQEAADTKVAGEGTEQSAVKKESKGKDEKNIPKDLLPGGAEEALDGSASSEAAGSSDTKEYEQSKEQGGSATQRANQTEDAGGSTQNGNGSTENSAVTVQLVVESSQAETYGYSVNYAVTLELKKGATVYEALKQSGIESSGNGYIESIGGLPEKAAGAMSGWKYYVNGKEPSVSAKDYVLQDGDQVQWSYVLKP